MYQTVFKEDQFKCWWSSNHKYWQLLTLSIKALIENLLHSFLRGLECMLTPGFAIVWTKDDNLSLLPTQRSKVRYLDDYGAEMIQYNVMKKSNVLHPSRNSGNWLLHTTSFTSTHYCSHMLHNTLSLHHWRVKGSWIRTLLKMLKLTRNVSQDRAVNVYIFSFMVNFSGIVELLQYKWLEIKSSEHNYNFWFLTVQKLRL